MISRPVVVMGVAGSGKSVVGRGIAAALARPFIDADDLHPRTNIDKMRRGEPLDDIDRAPWLDAVGAALAATALAAAVAGPDSAAKRSPDLAAECSAEPAAQPEALTSAVARANHAEAKPNPFFLPLASAVAGPIAAT